MSPARGLSLAVLPVVILGVVFAGCGGQKTVTTTVADPGFLKRGVGPPGKTVQFGYIKSLKRHGDHYILRLDPAWVLSGLTANTAAAEDGAVEPGQPVPNDHYIVDEGHRLLTYRVPTNAHVTVLKTGPDGKPITVAQLARIVRNPNSTKLFEPISTGVWVLVDIDTVRSIDQQYKP